MAHIYGYANTPGARLLIDDSTPGVYVTPLRCLPRVQNAGGYVTKFGLKVNFVGQVDV